MKYVTLGWDGLPTTVNEDGTIYPREAELIFNKKYYPKWPEETWPVDPETGFKLPIESPGMQFLQRHDRGNNRGGSKGIFKRIRQVVQALFRH